MAGVVARSGAAAVLMHMKGTPATMQDDPRYDDLVGEIAAFLDDRLRVAEAAGVPRERIVVDPGIGFGKTVDHNLEIMRRAADFQALGRPLLLGFSRKAFLGRVLGGLPPEERLEATLAAAVLAVERGAHTRRGHPVGPGFRAVRAAAAVLAGGPAGPAPAEGRAGHVR